MKKIDNQSKFIVKSFIMTGTACLFFVSCVWVFHKLRCKTGSSLVEKQQMVKPRGASTEKVKEIKTSQDLIVYSPENWKHPLAISVLEGKKPISVIPMSEFLKSCGKKADFEGKVYLVTLENGIRAVFKPVVSENLQDAKAEVIAYKASVLLGFPYIPPTILTEINGQKGSLQLFVETSLDLLQPGAYKSVLQQADKDDLAALKLFYFIFGQWDSGAHNLLALKREEKTYLIAIDNSGICNRQFVRYGELPFVRVFYDAKLDTDDWDKPFPFDSAKTIEYPTSERLKNAFGDKVSESFFAGKNGKPYERFYRYVVYQNSIWRQFHSHSESFVKSYTKECPINVQEAIKKLDLETLKGLFSLAKDEDFLTEKYLASILERRDQSLKGLSH